MPFSACVRCADCDGFPCLVHAKADAEVVAAVAEAGEALGAEDLGPLVEGKI